MRTIKTPTNQRSTYTYIDALGKKHTIKPGDVDPDTGYILTEEDIKSLHRMDDREVDNNCKNLKSPIQPWEKPIINEWKRNHPYEDLPSRSHVSIDAEGWDDEGNDNDSDKGYCGVASLVVTEKKESPMLMRLHDIVDLLEPERRQLYQRVIVDGESLTQIAKEEGVSVVAIHNRIEKIKRFIEKNF